MTHAEIETIRPPAVDGAFYPRDRRALDRTLDHLLAAPGTGARDRPIRALVVPHAGWTYSGELAGRAFARLADSADSYRRVLLLGPCHRVWVPIMALPEADAFETPLGRIPVDDAWRAAPAWNSAIEPMPRNTPSRCSCPSCSVCSVTSSCCP